MSSPWRSPLADPARALGAAIGVRRGVETATRFGELETEWRAAREGAVVVDLAFRTTLLVSGPDARDFLHNVTSQDVAGLGVGETRYATLLTRQSKVVSDLHVLAISDDAFLLDVERALAGAVREHLDRHLVAEEVEIEDRGERAARIGIAGPAADEVVRALAASEPIFRTDGLGRAAFDWVVEWEAAAERWSAARAAGAQAIGFDAFEIFRLEAGAPWPGVDFDLDTLVLEAGLEAGIHRRKGCYVGQEVVERQSARGQVNRRRVGLRVEGEGPPDPGAPVSREGRDVGRVTSAGLSLALGAPLAIAIVRSEAAGPGSRVEVAGRPAEVLELPLRG